MTGQTLSHYRVFERLGEGATSVVYKAEDLALGRPVALKLLPPGLSLDLGVIARFQHEARTASSLNHPNICTIYEIGEHEGRQFIVMEFLEGQVLSKVIAGRPLDGDRLLEISIQIADGLAAAHAEGVIHQDVKPANIYVTQRDHAKLLDFGLAVLMPAASGDRSSASAVWLSGVGGTAPYMSPEQTRGELLDPRSDLFSFGVTLYEMATGRRPFVAATSAAVMEAIRSEIPPRARERNTSIPEELDRILEKALEKNRKLRYQTASDIGADLRRLQRDLDSQTRVSVPSPAAARVRVAAAASRNVPWPQQWTFIAGIAAALAAMLAYASVRPSAGAAKFDSSAESAIVTLAPAPASAPVGQRPLDAASTRSDSSPRTAATTTGPSASTPLRERPAAPELPTNVARPANAESAQRRWAEEQLAIARSKVSLKLYDQALDTLRDLVAREGTTDVALDAYLLTAAIYEIRDKREDAIATYVDIATRYRNSGGAPEALVRMGDAMLQSRRDGKEQDALKVYADVAERYPSTQWAERALMSKGALEERLKTYQRDAALATSVPSALVTYRHLVTTYPESAEREAALWNLAQIYQRIKRFDLAADTLTALGEAYPASRHDAWFTAAEIYEKRLKAPSDARAAYARVPSTSPRFVEAQKRLTKTN